MDHPDKQTVEQWLEDAKHKHCPEDVQISGKWVDYDFSYEITATKAGKTETRSLPKGEVTALAVEAKVIELVEALREMARRSTDATPRGVNVQSRTWPNRLKRRSFGGRLARFSAR